jgi:hypothetical protein
MAHEAPFVELDTGVDIVVDHSSPLLLFRLAAWMLLNEITQEFVDTITAVNVARARLDAQDYSRN